MNNNEMPLILSKQTQNKFQNTERTEVVSCKLPRYNGVFEWDL